MNEKLLKEAGKDICLRNLAMIIAKETMFDEAVEKLIKTSKRTLSEAYDYVKDAARKGGRHGLISVSSREVYGWICEFYNMSEDKYQELNGSVNTGTESPDEQNISVVTVLPLNVKKNEPAEQMEGQMNIFDFIL